MTPKQIRAKMRRRQAAIFCGICFQEIFHGRKIFEKAFKALQRHLLIDHVNGGAGAGIVFFKDNGSSWTTHYSICARSQHEDIRVPPLPRTTQKRHPQDETQQMKLAAEFCESRGIPHHYNPGGFYSGASSFHLVDDKTPEPETLEEARIAFEKSTRRRKRAAA